MLPEDCFAKKDIVSTHTTVAVNPQAIWVVDTATQAAVKQYNFPNSFPSYRSTFSKWGNSLQLTIADNGSVAFCAQQELYVWDYVTNQVHHIATVKWSDMISNAVAMSADGQKVATVSQVDWEVRAWSVLSGKLLATFSPAAANLGALSELAFTPDGNGLTLDTEVSAQSGSDYQEHFAWKI